MKLHFTSGYHPEADGQTESTNQTLEHYIQVYCNYQQDNWSELLPLAEFAYNNALSATTGVTPFFANKGYHLNISVYPECDLASARAWDFVTDPDELHQELHTAMTEAQEHYKISADQNRLLAPDFQIGQNVMVKAKYIKTTQPSRKLGPKNHGPFKIIAKSSLDVFAQSHVFIQVHSDIPPVHSDFSDSSYTFKKTILLLH